MRCEKSSLFLLNFFFQVIFLLSLPRSGEKSVPGQPSRGFRNRLQRDEILETEAAIATEPAGRRGGGHPSAGGGRRPRAGVHTRPPSKEMGGDFFFFFFSKMADADVDAFLEARTDG